MKKLLVLLVLFASTLPDMAQKTDSAEQARRNERLINRALFHQKFAVVQNGVGTGIAACGLLSLIIGLRGLDYYDSGDELWKYSAIAAGAGPGAMAAGAGVMQLARLHKKRSGRLLIKAGLVSVAPAVPSTAAYGYGVRMVVPINPQRAKTFP